MCVHTKSAETHRTRSASVWDRDGLDKSHTDSEVCQQSLPDEVITKVVPLLGVCQQSHRESIDRTSGDIIWGYIIWGYIIWGQIFPRAIPASQDRHANAEEAWQGCWQGWRRQAWARAGVQERSYRGRRGRVLRCARRMSRCSRHGRGAGVRVPRAAKRGGLLQGPTGA
jgi:hypothetical protein